MKVDSIHLETLDVQVDWQLDRYDVWPAVKRPKGGKTAVWVDMDVPLAPAWLCVVDPRTHD